LLRDKTFQKNFDGVFLAKAAGAQKIDTNDNIANLGAKFANLLQGGVFSANDFNKIDPDLKAILYDPNINKKKGEPLFASYKNMKDFYTKYFTKLPSSKNKSMYGLLSSLVLLSSGSYHSAEQRSMLSDMLFEAFSIQDAAPLANLFHRLSNISENDPGINKVLSAFALKYKGKINFTDKFITSKQVTKKGKNKKGQAINYGLKQALGIDDSKVDKNTNNKKSNNN